MTRGVLSARVILIHVKLECLVHVSEPQPDNQFVLVFDTVSVGHLRLNERSLRVVFRQLTLHVIRAHVRTRRGQFNKTSLVGEQRAQGLIVVWSRSQRIHDRLRRPARRI